MAATGAETLWACGGKSNTKQCQETPLVEPLCSLAADGLFKRFVEKRQNHLSLDSSTVFPERFLRLSSPDLFHFRTGT